MLQYKLTNICRILALLIIKISVTAEVQITKQPEPKEVTLGESATFSIEAFAPPGESILYQWYFNETALSGATGSNLTISNIQRKNLGKYWVRVGNLSGTKDSTKVALTALIGAPSSIFPSVEIEIRTDSGSTYVLQRSFDLETWVNFGDPVTGTGAPVSLLFPTRPNAHTFYRVMERLDGPEIPRSLNGIKMFFTVTNPVGRGPFEATFSGAAGAPNGLYVTIGSTQDNGTYSYSSSGPQGTIIVVSSVFVGASARFILDFANFTYTKYQNNQLIESGTFSL
jgi:hypothetical protein